MGVALIVKRQALFVLTKYDDIWISICQDCSNDGITYINVILFMRVIYRLSLKSQEYYIDNKED